MCSFSLGRALPANAALSLALTLPACGPGNQSSTSATTTLSTSETNSDGATTTETGGTSTDTIDTATETSSIECAPGPVEGEFECEPPGASIGSFTFPPGTSVPRGTCTLLTVMDDEVEVQTLTLKCGPSVPFDVEIHTAAPHVPIEVTEGMSVTIDHAYVGDECRGTGFVALHDEDDNLLFGGINAPTAALWPAPLSWSPLQISLADSNCPGMVGDCGIMGTLITHRSALRVSLDDAMALVFPGNSATVGEAYTINVSRADSLVCLMTTPCGYNCSNVNTTAVWVRGIAH